METSAEQQILEYFNKSSKVLVALPKALSFDHLCAAVAVQSVLAKLGKTVDLVSSSQAIPRLPFLAEQPGVLSHVTPQDVLVVNLDTSRAKLDELSYQEDERGVRIFLKPKDGLFDANDIHVTVGGSGYDLVTVIGAQTLDDLGELYQDNSQLFFDTPKINIDTRPANEYFGTINLVEVTASCVSELVAQMLLALEPVLVEEIAATTLLGGIIAQTHSFQDVATTPNTFTIASNLISRGARQQDIIQKLFKTKEFSLLKLWGRALARIKTTSDGSVLYSILTQADFEKTANGTDRLAAVLKEMAESVSGYQLIVLMVETGSEVKVFLAGLPHTSLKETAQRLGNAAPVVSHLTGLYSYCHWKTQGTAASLEAKLTG